jgi:hypothetical protein
MVDEKIPGVAGYLGWGYESLCSDQRIINNGNGAEPQKPNNRNGGRIRVIA